MKTGTQPIAAMHSPVSIAILRRLPLVPGPTHEPANVESTRLPFLRALRGVLVFVVSLQPGLATLADAPPLANPPFALLQEGNAWWLVSPQGERFFSVGICLVSRGASREAYDPENPGYAAWRFYPDDRSWADATLRRLNGWGFTTIGAWSENAVLLKSPYMLRGLTPVLHMGSTAGAPWWDMWDQTIIQRMDEVARNQILAVRNDPRVIGYYSDNEMGWWNAALFHMALEQPATSGQRQRLLHLLRETYAGDWARLAADFEPEFADSFETLSTRGQLWLRPGGSGIRVMRRFLGLVASRYYELVHQIIRKYDRRALILGDRYQSFYYPEVVQAAAPYVDAISSNLNAQWTDGTYLKFYLDTLHALSGRPVAVSEYYMAAMENRSGDRNSAGGFPVVQTQKERAAALRTTLSTLARTPYVIGADWFQYFDEPRHGREDGENFNFGLVDIADRPYAELTSAFATARLNGIKAAPPPVRPDVTTSGIPGAPRQPFQGAGTPAALLEWDRERGFVPPRSPDPIADLYLCWSPSALYLGLYALDIIEDDYYRNKSVPKVDRALWVIHAGDGAPIRARIGSGREAIVSENSIRLENFSGLNLNVRIIAIAEIPASRFGRNRFHTGDTVDLRTTLWTHQKAYRVDWNGIYTLGR